MDFPPDRLDRLRFESIERRRQLCSDVVKGRKRKLSELYFLSRSPLLPVTAELIASEDDYLMAFLEKNDLESGHIFDESSLPRSIFDRKGQPYDNGVTQQAMNSRSPARRGIPPGHAIDGHRLTPSLSQQKSGYIQGIALQQLPQGAAAAQPQQRPVQAIPQMIPAAGLSPAQPIHAMPTNIIQGMPGTPVPQSPALVQLQASTPQSSGHLPISHRSERRRTLSGSLETALIAQPKTIPQYIAPEDPPARQGVPLLRIYCAVQSSPLAALVPYSHKALTTDNYLTFYTETMLANTFKRMDELKAENKWSLRQPQRFRAPKRTKCHWDYLLDEMQISAYNSADRRLDWENNTAKIANASACISPPPPRILGDEEVAKMNEVVVAAAGEQTATDEDTPIDDVISQPTTGMEESSTVDDKRSNNDIEDTAVGFYSKAHFSRLDPLKQELFRDSVERMPIVPISKYSMMTSNIRMDYVAAWEKHQEDLSSPQPQLHQPPQAASADLDPQPTVHRPMFISETARRGVYVKAPMPPALKYVEFGAPTIWLPQDDANLLKLTSEFCYNWDVVAAHMNPRQSWSVNSNIERRTPWECFERWMQLEPNFQTTDLRGTYARPAQIWLDAMSRVQTHTKRRMTPMGIPSDNAQKGQRRLRWSGMFEAIRKSIRKREGSRPAQAASAAAISTSTATAAMASNQHKS
ncbi:uncharacterized protein V1518DRAFT_441719 [Limtongia smithiae]|uniref:uncharacterized protein n=1 Tax=Limtongia smithiae TaxID=1125753 RepID=UPI0034CD6FC4